MVTIKQATEVELNDIAPLFNAYRVFYRQTPNETAASDFMENKFVKKVLLFFSLRKTGPSKIYPTVTLHFIRLT